MFMMSKDAMNATPMLASTLYLDSHDAQQAEKLHLSACTLPCRAMAEKGIAEENGWPVSRVDAPAHFTVPMDHFGHQCTSA